MTRRLIHGLEFEVDRAFFVVAAEAEFAPVFHIVSVQDPSQIVVATDRLAIYRDDHIA